MAHDVTFLLSLLCREININEVTHRSSTLLVYSQFCLGLMNTRDRWYRRWLIIIGELRDLRAVVSERVLALRGLQQAAADAESCPNSTHAELLQMMAAMLSNNLQTGHIKSLAGR